MLIQFVYPTTYNNTRQLRYLPDLPTSARTLLYKTANLIELRRNTALLYLIGTTRLLLRYTKRPTRYTSLNYYILQQRY